MKNEIKNSASKTKRKRKIRKYVKLALLIFILLLLVVYLAMGLVYNEGNFSITLDKNLYLENNIIIYDDVDYKVFRTELYAPVVDTFDNIKGEWLPDDINDHDGSHNGDNYVAYTFYVENMGEEVSDYWSEVIIDDVIKDVDEAVRIRIYKNGNYMTYAKLSEFGEPEKDTVAFESDEVIARDHVEKFGSGDINKYTVVMWLEGTDPECTDNLLGGEIKIHMEFNSEFMEE